MPGLSLSPAAVESISLRAREHLTERELPRESVAVPEFSLSLLETRALQGKSVGAHLCMLRMQLSSGTSGHHMTLLKSSTLRGASSRRWLSSRRHQGRPVDGTQVLSKWPLSLGRWRLLFSLALLLGWDPIFNHPRPQGQDKIPGAWCPLSGVDRFT